MDIYDRVNVKNWSTQLIKTGLRIDQPTYDAIYTAVEHEMASRDLLGKRLNTIPHKLELKRTASAILIQFPSVFDDIPETWRARCLGALARKCNYNQKRRTATKTSTISVL